MQKQISHQYFNKTNTCIAKFTYDKFGRRKLGNLNEVQMFKMDDNHNKQDQAKKIIEIS